MSKSYVTISDLYVEVEGWDITRRRFRPTLGDRIFGILSFIPGLTNGPRTSLRERHFSAFPHQLSLNVMVAPGTYGVREAGHLDQSVSDTDLDMLTQRLWHTQGARLCTELNNDELERWKILSSNKLTLLFGPIPISLERLGE